MAQGLLLFGGMETAITSSESPSPALCEVLSALCEPPAPRRTFKSARAARMAYTKAEKAYHAARGEENRIRNEQRSADTLTWAPTDEESIRLDALRAEYERAHAEGVAYRDCAAFIAHCDLDTEIMNRPLRAAEAKRHAAWDAMKAIYDAADAQKIFIKSWHFGCNPTRDLIAANMD